MKDHPSIKAIRERADAHEAASVHPLCYLDEDDGIDRCRECATKEAKGRRICEADPSAHHDYPPTCHGCCKELAGHLTDDGAEEELACLEDRFDQADGRDCWIWCLCEMAFTEASEEYRRLLKVAGVEHG